MKKLIVNRILCLTRLVVATSFRGLSTGRKSTPSMSASLVTFRTYTLSPYLWPPRVAGKNQFGTNPVVSATDRRARSWFFRGPLQ